MQKLKIQQVCMEYSKNEYSYNPSTNSFHKAKEISSYPSDYIVEEFDDCWVVKSKPIEVIGEVISVHTEKCKSHLTHYQPNVTSIFVAYDVIGHNARLFGQTPSSYAATTYNGKPTIKVRFALCNLIITQEM